jgi:hypothetical protein
MPRSPGRALARFFILIVRNVVGCAVGRPAENFAGILSRQAAGVPVAPAHASETLKIGCERPLGSPLMGSDTSLGLRYLSLQPGYRLSLRLAGRTGDFANPETGNFHRLQGVAVLFELNPVPSDVAVAVGNHGTVAIGTSGRRINATQDRTRMRTG